MSLEINGGRLEYWADPQCFAAMCGDTDHVDAGGQPCCITKTANAGKLKAVGRPLGYLLAWLSLHSADRAAHMNLGMRRIARAYRLEARGRLEAMAAADGLSVAAQLLNRERPLVEDEPREPQRCP